MLSPFEKVDENKKVIGYISWNEVIGLTGFKDINQLDIALRNVIRGLVSKHRNEEDISYWKILAKEMDLLYQVKVVFRKHIKLICFEAY